MKIRDLLKPESIVIDAPVQSKDQAIEMLIDKHDEAGNLTDKAVYTEGILKRESESTTAIGEGIAIAHCKSDAVKNPGLAAMTVPVKSFAYGLGLYGNSPCARNAQIPSAVAATGHGPSFQLPFFC